MNLRLFLLVIIIMAIGFTHVSILNSQTVKFYLTNSKFIEIAISELTLITFALGAGIVLLGSFVKDAMTSAKQWKIKRSAAKKENAYGKLNKARNLLYKGKTKSALESVEDILSVIPENREALLLKAKVFREMGDYIEEVKTLQKLKSIDPSDVESYLLVAEAYDTAGDVDSALEILSPLKKQEDYLRIRVKLRDLLIKKGEYEKACEVQKGIIKKKDESSPEDQTILHGLKFELARNEFEKGNIDESEKRLKELVKEKTKFTPAYILLHEISLKKGTVNSAMDWLITGYRQTGNAINLIKLEDTAIEEEIPARLLEIYSQMTEEFSGDFTLILFYGKFLLRLEMVDEAMEQFLKAENLDLHNASIHIFLAESYRRRDRLQDAIDEYTKAFAYKRRYLVPFSCQGCGEKVIKWKPYCGKCQEWDRFEIDFGDTKELEKLRAEAVQKVPLLD